ncbi:MAG: exosortase/archaeosortase family protein [Gemmataceae bacterium]|nr:exosortase/archaeosortase family protein [Gemmataceae bacterium]
MPFVTKCPSCGNKYTVQQRSIGSSMDCSACNKPFRILPDASSNPAPEIFTFKEPEPQKQEKEVKKEVTRTIKKPVESSIDVEFNPPSKSRSNSIDVEYTPEAKPRYSERQRDWFSGDGTAVDNFLGLVAVFLSCISLLAASFPVIDYLVIPLGIAGMGLAIYSAILEGSIAKRFTFPLVALLISVPTIMIIINSPDWFREYREKPKSISIKDKFVLVAPGERPFLPEKPDQPVNSSQYGIQRNDIRAVISEVRYRRIEYTQSKVKKFTKDAKITVLIKVFNAGYEKPFDFANWQSYGNGVKLYDTDGSELPSWKPPANPGAIKLDEPTKTVFAGKMIEETLTFDAPKTKFEELRLLLPAKAFGEEPTLDKDGQEQEGKIIMIIPFKMITP